MTSLQLLGLSSYNAAMTQRLFANPDSVDDGYGDVSRGYDGDEDYRAATAVVNFALERDLDEIVAAFSDAGFRGFPGTCVLCVDLLF